MTNSNPTEPLIDPHLEHLLHLLRKAPARDEAKARQGRERFLAELEPVMDLKQVRSFGWLPGWFWQRQKSLEEKPMKTRTKLAFTALMAAVVLVVFLFGGAGATAFAARSALPGDALYPVKTSLEHTRVALSGNPYAQAQLNMRFAELRLEELNALIEQGRYGDFDQVAQQFEQYIAAALRETQTVMTGDPALGAQLSNQINQALLRYAQMLKSTWAVVPPQARPPLERMILTSEFGSKSEDKVEMDEIEITGIAEAISASAWTVSGKTIQVSSQTEIKDAIQVGDTVKVHAVKADDGSLLAREIELEDEAVIGDNENDNDDGIANDNEVENENDNEDKIGNDNEVENENDNDDKIVNENDNENVNDNDQGNFNDNDNENVNDNDNKNGNDNDNENGNDDHHDGGNDNGNDNGGEHNDNGGDD